MATRIDILLTEKGYTRSRSEAQDLIKRGKVSINGTIVDKASREFSNIHTISIHEEQYVGRGALKLEHALTVFNIEVKNKVCIDVGASTGGFTEVLLRHDAKKVIAIDSGSNQLAQTLVQDTRVYNLEKTDIRDAAEKHALDDILEHDEQIELCVVDVSFISLKGILPAIKALMSSSRTQDRKYIVDIICLVKPQFEVGKEYIGKNGIVQIEKKEIKDAVESVIDSIVKCAESLGYTYIHNLIESPIKGGSGNTEYLLHISYK